MLKKNTFRNFYFIVSIYLIGILAFSLFRIIFLLFNFEQTATIPDKALLIAEAFFMGFRFDTVISMYILAPPALLLFIFQIIRKNFAFVNKVLLTYIITLYLISFIICSADIPFFKQFFSRFSVVAFNWFDSPGFVFKMIFQEVRYFAFSIVFIAFAIVFVIIVIKFYRRLLVKMKFDKETAMVKYLLLFQCSQQLA